MIDKLHLKTNQRLNFEELSSAHKELEVSRVLDSQYKRAIKVSSGSKHVATIKSDPIWSHVSETQIQLNPTNWENFSLLKYYLSNLCDVNELEVSRIDSAVDLNTSLDEVHAQVRVKYKQDKRGYFESLKSGKLTGFYLGQKPEVFCIYDKAFQLERYKLKRLKHESLGIKTRVEVRQEKNKLPVKSFGELNLLLQYNPFRNLEFKKLEINEESKKAKHLSQYISSRGYSECYQAHNNSNNFKRDFGQYFKDVPQDKELKDIYWENLSQFFMEDKNVNE
jgi:hypothetical protein